MKMKSHISIYIIVVLFISFINNACTDLEETVYDKMLSEQFEPNERDIAALIGNCYTQLQNILFDWRSYYDAQEECSDILVTNGRYDGAWIDNGVYKNMHQHTWNSETGPAVMIYPRSYTGISYINQNLNLITTGDLPVGVGEPEAIAEAMKDSLKAELKALRAFYYYLLCDNYGNVPIVTSLSDSLPEQSSRVEVYNFIVNELKESIPLLSPAKTLETYGRMNRWAGLTLLAKVYQNAEVYTGQARWDECATYCDSVIASGKFILDDDYSLPFSTYNDLNSEEIIFAIPFTDDLGRMVGGWFMLLNKTLHTQNQSTYGLIEAPWHAGGMCGIPQFINTYHPNDLRFEKTWISGQQYSNTGDSLFCSLDPKLLDVPLAYTNTLPGIDYADEYEGLRIGKFEIEYGTEYQLENDFPFFRYADILMMKAECLLRTGDAAGAAELVTEVRRRVFEDENDAIVTADTLVKGSLYNYGLVDEVGNFPAPGGGSDIEYGRFLDELGWEFACEARRRQDLIRFGVFTTKDWYNSKPLDVTDPDADDHTNIFPIQQLALDNNYKLQQNPGY